MPKTLYDKLWDAHVVVERDDGNSLIYIDRNIIHEVTSAQAFEGLRTQGRPLWRADSIFAVADHQVPTTDRAKGLDGFTDLIAREQVETLDSNCRDYGIQQFLLSDPRQGIVHIVGPEQGITLPGMSVVCGDSHTSTHGALSALAQGIGTSDLEHVFATQCLLQRKCRNLRVEVNGELGAGVSAKDLALHIIRLLGSAGGNGFAIEYAGEAVRALSMEGRFTLCNMTIEAGARTGLVAFDEVTEAYVRSRPYAPKEEDFMQALDSWRALYSDPDAVFDKQLMIDAATVAPSVSWGVRPDQTLAINECIPRLSDAESPEQRSDWQHALAYMGLAEGTALSDIAVDQVFIGSCTNGRIEDLRAAAGCVKGRAKHIGVKRVLVVPGSGEVKRQAEQEGLDEIFRAAGFEWREPGCSMCNAMNPDQLAAGERCASTSNRNFEGRQGYRGRTHLVSPVMAVAAAIHGRLFDCREDLA